MQGQNRIRDTLTASKDILLARAKLEIPKSQAGWSGSRPNVAHVADAALSWQQVELPPRDSANTGKAPVGLSVVHVQEQETPANGGGPLEGVLLTTFPVRSRKQALEVLELYRPR